MASYPADFVGLWKVNQATWSLLDTDPVKVLEYDRDRFSLTFSRSTSGGSPVTVRPTAPPDLALGDGIIWWEGALTLKFADIGGAIQEPWHLKVQSPGVVIYVLEVLFRRT